MLSPTTTLHYLVWIRFRRNISFVTSFTISKWLKMYYFVDRDNFLKHLKAFSVFFYQKGSPYEGKNIKGLGAIIKGVPTTHLIFRGERGNEPPTLHLKSTCKLTIYFTFFSFLLLIEIGIYWTNVVNSRCDGGRLWEPFLNLKLGYFWLSLFYNL